MKKKSLKLKKIVPFYDDLFLILLIISCWFKNISFSKCPNSINMSNWFSDLYLIPIPNNPKKKNSF